MGSPLGVMLILSIGFIVIGGIGGLLYWIIRTAERYWQKGRDNE